MSDRGIMTLLDTHAREGKTPESFALAVLAKIRADAEEAELIAASDLAAFQARRSLLDLRRIPENPCFQSRRDSEENYKGIYLDAVNAMRLAVRCHELATAAAADDPALAMDAPEMFVKGNGGSRRSHE
jgi:hypothetical protein